MQVTRAASSMMPENIGEGFVRRFCAKIGESELREAEEFEVMSVPSDVGEVLHPITGDKESGVAVERLVEQDVQVREDKEADVGVRAEVVVGKGDEAVGRRLLSLPPAVAGALEGEGDGPSGMNGGEETLAAAVAKDRL